MTDLPPSDSSEPLPGSADPVDELLRTTMRALDAQTPAATFEALPLAVDAAIDAGAGMGDSGELALGGLGVGAVAGEERELLDDGRRGRRSSASQLRQSAPELGRGAAGGRRRGSSGAIAPMRQMSPSAAPATKPVRAMLMTGPAVSDAAPVATPSERARRRSMLETQVGAPLAWWQTRAAAMALVGVALAAAVVLVVLRQRGGHAPEEGISASADKLRDPRKAPRAPSVQAPVIPAVTPEQARLRKELAAVLPTARACVAQRPLDGVELTVVVAQSGAVEAVAVAGALAATPAGECIAAALRGAKLAAWPAAATVKIPLFE
jgi:hypothetical protein